MARSALGVVALASRAAACCERSEGEGCGLGASTVASASMIETFLMRAWSAGLCLCHLCVSGLPPVFSKHDT